MLELPELIDKHASELVTRLPHVPDSRALLRRLQAILSDHPPPPWFPSVRLESFIKGVQEIEDFIISRMSWEVHPDPVARAHARAQLRRGLAKLSRQFAAGIDQEIVTLRARQQVLAAKIERKSALARALIQLHSYGVVVLGMDGHLQSWNSEVEKLYEVGGDELVGRSIRDFAPGVFEKLRSRTGGSAAEHGSSILGGVETMSVGPEKRPVEISYRLVILDSYPGPRGECAVLSIWLE